MNPEDFKNTIHIDDNPYSIADINILSTEGIADLARLPFSIKILVENLLRKFDGKTVLEEDILNIARWKKESTGPVEIPYHPARVLMQDFTGVPALVDLAGLRDAVKASREDPSKINPAIPVDLVIDHSVQVDSYGTSDSLSINIEKEYQRNGERYSFLKWAQKKLSNIRVIPPGTGICHQANLEFLGKIVISETMDGQQFLYPDTLVGTDSHTTMINGIGILGWGVGGIEAEAAMLGEPYYIQVPEVLGCKLTGALQEGATATDLVLSITEELRKRNVVGKFVEYFGPGLQNLSVPDRATISNMSPEYGATVGFFPVDQKTLDYLVLTSRKDLVPLVEGYTKMQGLFYDGSLNPEYTEIMEFDLSSVEPSIAGPARPQDRIPLKTLKDHFYAIIDKKKDDVNNRENTSADMNNDGCNNFQKGQVTKDRIPTADSGVEAVEAELEHGSIVIAAITSCTNTSNPTVMAGAGLLAKKAVEAGLTVLPHIKTSLVPGSRVVDAYLRNSGLLEYLEALNFYTTGYGCTTCIGNSGPLHPRIEEMIAEKGLTVAAVLSGNRNFEARIHQSVRANFLMSPLLVVAFAIAGTINIDMDNDPLGYDLDKKPVFLRDIWPRHEEIEAIVKKYVQPDLFRENYKKIFDGDERWKNLPSSEGTVFSWDPASTHIKSPPYFEDFSMQPDSLTDIHEARALLMLGDSVTTDHVSPAGAIPADYPAGQYLIGKKVEISDFNSYGSRRGNHEVMIRGTFGNVRIKNKMVEPREGSFTKLFPEGKEAYIFDAAASYKEKEVPLVVMAGTEYGTGSSRDWAAKGTLLLGIKAVIAESYERIHRSNLVGMGVLPLQFSKGTSWKTLNLDGSEVYQIEGIINIKPGDMLTVTVKRDNEHDITFDAIARLDTHIDVEYFKNRGILPYILRKNLATSKVS